MRAVLYLRMSTDKQETSIGQQRDALVAFALKQGHEIIREYVDEGISGDATHKRKGFQAMIRDAAAGNFDRILCWDQSRFGRFDSIEAGSWITPLRDAGVSLETMDGGAVDWNDFAGRITYAVAQEGKHAFLRDLSRSALRGMAAKVRDGRGLPGGPTPYGYRREMEIDGRKRIATLVPDEITAPVVRRIFEEYAAAGGSLYTVVSNLNREGLRSPSGRPQWRRSAVRFILGNHAYCGDLSWGRTASGKYHTRAGDEIVARRPGLRPTKNVPIVRRDTIPPLVERELFGRVHELLAKRKKATRPAITVRPLSGILVCGCCGSSMHTAGKHYRCSKRNDFGIAFKCTASAVRADAALDALAGGLRRNLLAPARLKAVKERLERLVDAERNATPTVDTAAIERRIADLDRQVAEGIARITLIPKGLVPDMAKGLDALRAQRDALSRKQEAIGRAQEGERLPVEERVAQALAAAYGLRDALREGDADPALVNQLLRTLGVRVTVSPPAGTVVVDPVPEIGRDLSNIARDVFQASPDELPVIDIHSL